MNRIIDFSWYCFVGKAAVDVICFRNNIINMDSDSQLRWLCQLVRRSFHRCEFSALTLYVEPKNAKRKIILNFSVCILPFKSNLNKLFFQESLLWCVLSKEMVQNVNACSKTVTRGRGREHHLKTMAPMAVFKYEEKLLQGAGRIPP